MTLCVQVSDSADRNNSFFEKNKKKTHEYYILVKETIRWRLWSLWELQQQELACHVCRVIKVSGYNGHLEWI